MARAKKAFLLITVGAVFLYIAAGIDESFGRNIPAAMSYAANNGNKNKGEPGNKNTGNKGSSLTVGSTKPTTEGQSGGDGSVNQTTNRTGPFKVEAGASSSPSGQAGSASAGVGPGAWWVMMWGLGIVALGLAVLTHFTFKLNKIMKEHEGRLIPLESTKRVGPVAKTENPKDETKQPESPPNPELSPDLLKLDQRVETLELAKIGLEETMRSLTTRVDNVEEGLDDIEKQLPAPKEPTAGGDVTASQYTDLPEPEADTAAVADAPNSQPPLHVTVNKMVEWAQNLGLPLKSVKADVGLLGNFTTADDGDNWLVTNTPTNKSYLFPRTDRFETASHYSMMYSAYYDCDQPSAGTILIDQPALVEADSEQGGWKLGDKGKLSVTS